MNWEAGELLLKYRVLEKRVPSVGWMLPECPSASTGTMVKPNMKPAHD